MLEIKRVFAASYSGSSGERLRGQEELPGDWQLQLMQSGWRVGESLVGHQESGEGDMVVQRGSSGLYTDKEVRTSGTLRGRMRGNRSTGRRSERWRPNKKHSRTWGWRLERQLVIQVSNTGAWRWEVNRAHRNWGLKQEVTRRWVIKAKGLTVSNKRRSAEYSGEQRGGTRANKSHRYKGVKLLEVRAADPKTGSFTG